MHISYLETHNALINFLIRPVSVRVTSATWWRAVTRGPTASRSPGEPPLSQPGTRGPTASRSLVGTLNPRWLEDCKSMGACSVLGGFQS